MPLLLLTLLPPLRLLAMPLLLLTLLPLPRKHPSKHSYKSTTHAKKADL
ncbi:MAG TPA: hypothetical protein VL051_06725 [Burkholderiaceae bacterium]|nr:hypothetical protein [Burkholderiaceae bacterium]